jgi:hypothetical protein
MQRSPPFDGSGEPARQLKSWQPAAITAICRRAAICSLVNRGVPSILSEPDATPRSPSRARLLNRRAGGWCQSGRHTNLAPPYLVVRRHRSRRGLTDATERVAGRLRVVGRRRITQRYDSNEPLFSIDNWEPANLNVRHFAQHVIDVLIVEGYLISVFITSATFVSGDMPSAQGPGRRSCRRACHFRSLGSAPTSFWLMVLAAS